MAGGGLHELLPVFWNYGWHRLCCCLSQERCSMLLTFMTKPDMTMVGVASAEPRLRRSARSPFEWTVGGLHCPSWFSRGECHPERARAGVIGLDCALVERI